MVIFDSKHNGVSSNSYFDYNREDDGYVRFNIACGHRCDTEIKFSEEGVTIKVDSKKGSLDYYGQDNKLLASVVIPPSSEGKGCYCDISCKVAEGKIILRLPSYSWYDNYPNCDGENDRWEYKITGYKKPICFCVSTGRIIPFHIEYVIKKLSEKRKVFVSEADLQLELAWMIRQEYPEAMVRMEYCPVFDPNMHIDILVIIDGKWYPIELKYKTKGCEITEGSGEVFRLKNHSAKDVNCYRYLRDIERIESIKKQAADLFSEGYTVFITNDPTYLKEPTRETVNYYAFSLHKGVTKTGELDWGFGTSSGTKGEDCKKPIHIDGEYKIEWKEYSRFDDSNTGTFMITMCKITKKMKEEDI